MRSNGKHVSNRVGCSCAGTRCTLGKVGCRTISGSADAGHDYLLRVLHGDSRLVLRRRFKELLLPLDTDHVRHLCPAGCPLETGADGLYLLHAATVKTRELITCGSRTLLLNCFELLRAIGDAGVDLFMTRRLVTTGGAQLLLVNTYDLLIWLVGAGVELLVQSAGDVQMGLHNAGLDRWLVSAAHVRSGLVTAGGKMLWLLSQLVTAGGYYCSLLQGN